MMAELAATFDGIRATGGRVYLLPVYDAGGTAQRVVNAEDLLARLRPGDDARVVEDFETCAEAVADGSQAGDAVLVMGARDPGLPVFCRRLLERLQAA